MSSSESGGSISISQSIEIFCCPLAILFSCQCPERRAFYIDVPSSFLDFVSVDLALTGF